MPDKQTQRVGFYIFLGLALLLAAWLLSPFWQLLALAVILPILFHPMFLYCSQELRSKNLAAGLTVVVIILIIAGPLALISQQVFTELAGLYGNINFQTFGQQVNSVIATLPPGQRQFILSLTGDLSSLASQLMSQAFVWFSGLLSSLGWLFGSLVVVAISTFFLLRDGDGIKQYLAELLPLSSKNESLLFKKLELAVSGVERTIFGGLGHFCGRFFRILFVWVAQRSPLGLRHVFCRVCANLRHLPCLDSGRGIFVFNGTVAPGRGPGCMGCFFSFAYRQFICR